MNKNVCNEKANTIFTSFISSQHVQPLAVSRGTNQGPKVNERSIFSFFPFFKPAPSLFNRFIDSSLDASSSIFSTIDFISLLHSRLVSKQWLQLCDTEINNKVIFFDRACISFKYRDIRNSKINSEIVEKYEFAKTHTGINISITVNELLQKPSSLLKRFNSLAVNQPSFSFCIKTTKDLTRLNNHLASGKLSKEQIIILNKTKSLSIFNDCDEGETVINNTNINSINQLLATVAQPNGLFPQITTLKLGYYISDAWTLPSLPNISSLKFGHIRSDATITLPSFPNLLSLKFGNINAAMSLPCFPNLYSLEFEDINATLTLYPQSNLSLLKFRSIRTTLLLPVLPKLFSLKCGLIAVPMTLPLLPNLSCLEIGHILQAGAVTLPSLPNLSRLSLGEIFQHDFTLSPQPNLSSLSFGCLAYCRVTLPPFPNLSSLSLKKICSSYLALSVLPNLSSLSFGNIDGFSRVTLADLRQLILFSFRNYTILQGLKIILNFIINWLNILLGTSIKPYSIG